ncbi:hypothetical protein CVO96_20540 [Deinococcus koreensis]|uniref:Uncharacterized protein n=2 Tax=Deinococcus koreensis TaxID=2054903 RepID=A0A2K3URR4_9DEIO|nr:hypothetical protein CVO96_20540 [Deinococcus koreensis]
MTGTRRPDFTVDELEAAGRCEVELYVTVFVPIGSGQMVARPLVEATPSDFTAYWAWRSAMARMN